METVFGSLNHFEKGGVRAIHANPKHYAFSNIFEVASKSKPYEKVAVAQNVKYVIETLRAEGTSPWFAADHDESAVVMDGEIEIHLIQPDQPAVRPGKQGSVKLTGEPPGRKMGWMKVRRGHMALLPKGAAYQFRSPQPGVLILQTMKGDCTVERWAQICQHTY